MSTATERIMRERGDLAVFHEPFMHYYYRTKGYHRMPHFNYDPSHPAEPSEIVKMLWRKSEHAPVFAKDMSYYVLSLLQEQPHLCNNAKHFFLVRNPKRAIMSYHKLDPDVTTEEVGLNAQWQHYQYLKKRLPRAPMVIRAEDIQRSPVNEMQRLWHYLNLPFIEHAFDWSSDDRPGDWKQVEYWHQSARQSSAILPNALTDEDTDELFAQYARAHPKVERLYSAHCEAYFALIDQREQGQT